MPGIHNPLAACFMKATGAKLGKGVKVAGFPVCVRAPDSTISLGDGCTINSAFLSNLAGLYQRSVLVARDGATLRIGTNTGMSGVTLYAKKSIIVGDNCLLGANVKVFDSDFHPSDPEERLQNSNAGKCAPVKIGNNVFIGANSLVLKGVTIGDDAVVGAGSVVVHDVPSRAVVAGNPATVVKVYQ